MRKIVRLTESDLKRIVKKVLQEQTDDVEKQAAECIMDMLTLKDIVTIPFKYPKTISLLIAFRGKQKITFQMIKDSHNELSKNSDDACDKITKLIACMAKKNNMPVDSSIQSSLNTLCKTGAQFSQTIQDILKGSGTGLPKTGGWPGW